MSNDQVRDIKTIPKGMSNPQVRDIKTIPKDQVRDMKRIL